MNTALQILLALRPTLNVLSHDDEETTLYKHELNQPELDLTRFRKLCWSGITNPRDRADAWLVLLGVLPTQLSRRETVRDRKFREYHSFVKQYWKSESLHTTQQLRVILSQIQKDVPRTNPDIPMFLNCRIQECLERILYVWAVRHPAVGYVQGMNDIVSPFLTVFVADALGLVHWTSNDIHPDSLNDFQVALVECYTFWSACKVLESIQENFIFAQPGIQKQLSQFEELVRRIDKPLVDHFETQGLLFVQFAFRWMNCLLTRELTLDQSIRVFDTYLSEDTGYFHGFSVFHVYFCTALLLYFADKLRELEFQDMILFVQHLPLHQMAWKQLDMLLSQAYVYQTLFDDSPQHLIQ